LMAQLAPLERAHSINFSQRLKFIAGHHSLAALPFALFPIPCSLFLVYARQYLSPDSPFPLPYSLFAVPCSLFLICTKQNLSPDSPFLLPNSLFAIRYSLFESR
jgi:hypothetical protein